ncbi:MAG: pantoate--beta-alanine ligase [bacterium]
MPIFITPSDMRDWSFNRRAEGKTIGCVPTMGALHEGHLSLIRSSADECDETIVTVFVNPLQFGPTEDFGKYPRTLEQDLELSKKSGATLSYCPSTEAMYHKDHSVYVVEDSLSGVLCGKSRPNHFRGVLTVVAKLFNACMPHKAYFGKKDYQQLRLIERMVRDLDFPVEIIGCEIVREPDGLAMSSRNKYLNESERADAVSLSSGLNAAIGAFKKGERNPREIENEVLKILKPIKTARVDYVECRDAESLEEIERIDRAAVVAEAVFIGDTRLIDNIILNPDEVSELCFVSSC